MLLQPGVPNMADPSGYTVASGTSMATPHMAGAAALMRQLHPTWSPLQLKAALVNTARWMASQGSTVEQGNGRVDLAAAAGAPAVLVCDADQPQPTLSFGTVAHQSALVSTVRPLKIVDISGKGGRYSLRVHLANRAYGLSAAISHHQVTLHRECAADLELTLTIDGRSLADGAYYGFVVATGEGATLRLPFFLTTTGSDHPQADSPDATSTVFTA